MFEGYSTVHRPRRELQRTMPMGRGGLGGSSCGGFIVNGDMWCPESAMKGPGIMAVLFWRERESHAQIDCSCEFVRNCLASFLGLFKIINLQNAILLY